MALKLPISHGVLLLMLVVAAAGVHCSVQGAADDFADIWREGLDIPGQPDLSPERLRQVIEYVAKDDDQKSKQLHEMYEKDRDRFWAEVRDSFRRERDERGPDGGGRPPGNRGRWREQLQRRHDELVEWLKENFPDVEKELAAIRDKDGEEYAKAFSEIRRIYEPIMSTEGRNPKLGEVLKDERHLTMRRDMILKDIIRYGKKESLVSDLTRVVGERFDLIVEKKRLQFDELRERLEQLQRDLAKREKELGELVKSKDAATKSRVEALLNPKPKLDWE